MNIYFPMALSVNFKDFTLTDILGYIIAAAFFIIFALYYNRKNKIDNLSMAKRRDEYIQSHPGLSPEYQDAIKNGNIIDGMNEEEIISSLGYPKRTKILTVEPARSEVWIYRNGVYAHMHMGILQKWKIHNKFVNFS